MPGCRTSSTRMLPDSCLTAWRSHRPLSRSNAPTTRTAAPCAAATRPMAAPATRALRVPSARAGARLHLRFGMGPADPRLSARTCRRPSTQGPRPMRCPPHALCTGCMRCPPEAPCFAHRYAGGALRAMLSAHESRMASATPQQCAHAPRLWGGPFPTEAPSRAMAHAQSAQCADAACRASCVYPA